LHTAALSRPELLAVVAFVVFSAYANGIVLENKSYAVVIEWLRVPLLMAAMVVLPLPTWFSVTVFGLCLVSLPLLVFGKKQSMEVPGLLQQ
ncbi:MAG: hypothetical protein AAF197_09905, partial [Pseudomonadota bacterium]